jgi:hypothetical protein
MYRSARVLLKDALGATLPGAFLKLPLSSPRVLCLGRSQFGTKAPRQTSETSDICLEV